MNNFYRPLTLGRVDAAEQVVVELVRVEYVFVLCKHLVTTFELAFGALFVRRHEAGVTFTTWFGTKAVVDTKIVCLHV